MRKFLKKLKGGGSLWKTYFEKVKGGWTSVENVFSVNVIAGLLYYSTGAVIVLDGTSTWCLCHGHGWTHWIIFVFNTD